MSTARVLALLELLQSGSGVRTVGDLAGRLGVDERTVRRYAAHLVDLDVPVESVRGRYGGYRLAPGYRMPPLMLTDDEAVAVALGLVAGGRSGLAPASASASESAAAKLRRVLPRALASRLDALLASSFTGVPAGAVPVPAETDVLLRLAEAARDRRAVELGYVDRHGRRTDRVLRPYGIVAHAGRWYVTGNQPVRSFRLDRVTSLRVLDETFEPPDGFDPAAAVVAGLAGTPWRHRVVLLVEGEAPDVFPRGMATFSAEGGRTRVELRAERLDWVPSMLARIEAPFTVLEPHELRELVQALAGRLSAAAGVLGE